MRSFTIRPLAASVAIAMLAACHHGGFKPGSFASSPALFDASLSQLRQRHWGNAADGFEKLTTDLPARDPLLPRAYFYLGEARNGQHEYLLAAQAFSRVPESFPEDSLADDALLQAGLSYAQMWRKPELDPEYGQTALQTLQSFLAAYPDSPLKPRAQREIAQLNEWLAKKDYENGMLYYRRKAYDSAIIYFTSVSQQYPETNHAKLSLEKLAEAYDKIHYREERAETCATLHQKYPSDREVNEICGPPPVAKNPQP